MYPDATFIGIVRNAFAVCEGHAGRGASLEKFSLNYEKACLQMIRDSKDFPKYKIIRFKDLINESQETLKQIYSTADLKINKIKKTKLQAKKVIDDKGSHNLNKGKIFKEIAEYTIDNFENHFIKNVNENQIKRLSKSQMEIIERNCRKSMKYFSYL